MICEFLVQNADKNDFKHKKKKYSFTTDSKLTLLLKSKTKDGFLDILVQYLPQPQHLSPLTELE